MRLCLRMCSICPVCELVAEDLGVLNFYRLIVARGIVRRDKEWYFASEKDECCCLNILSILRNLERQGLIVTHETDEHLFIYSRTCTHYAREVAES